MAGFISLKSLNEKKHNLKLFIQAIEKTKQSRISTYSCEGGSMLTTQSLNQFMTRLACLLSTLQNSPSGGMWSLN